MDATDIRLLETERQARADRRALGCARGLRQSVALDDWIDVAARCDNATRHLSQGALDGAPQTVSDLLASIERAEAYLDFVDERDGLGDRQSRREKREARRVRRSQRWQSYKKRRGRRKEIRKEHRAERKRIRREVPRGERRAARKAARKTRRESRREVRKQRRTDRARRREIYKTSKSGIKSRRKERKDRSKAGISQDIQEVDPETAAAAGDGAAALDALIGDQSKSMVKVVGVGVGLIVLVGGVVMFVRHRRSRK